MPRIEVTVSVMSDAGMLLWHDSHVEGVTPMSEDSEGNALRCLARLESLVPAGLESVKRQAAKDLQLVGKESDDFDAKLAKVREEMKSEGYEGG
jgi:hypothetical protein